MSGVVCFKLVNGAEIVGKLSEEKTHRDFIDMFTDNVLYLEDAVFVGVHKMENGNPGLAFAPITGIGANPTEGKAPMPFALHRSAILGQIPLDPEIDKMYRESTSGIVLLR
jgi:hypothetical protein